ncbi:hypothetical protein [Frankia sp. AgB32]|uniref:hypothetical protein n=1 Tax=Frankia sp. AgB32 TaxID=631119 RepID=UPI00200DFAF1|nr:hypothetical protein [Frankia sp. AgB32]MCK9897005.1 hypothetical protein [Frankia sp. AgB32]
MRAAEAGRVGAGRRPVRGAIPTPVPVPVGVDPDELDVLAVPAGLWARVPGGPRVAPGEPALHALPDPDGAITVIAGAPGEPPPEVEAIVGLLRALAAAGRPDVIMAPYGTGADLPAALAAQLGVSVVAQHGLLFAGADGRPVVTVLDADRGWWQPLAWRTVYTPTGPPWPRHWRSPAEGLADLGGGRYQLTDGWSLRIVPSGLVLDPSSPVSDSFARSADTFSPSADDHDPPADAGSPSARAAARDAPGRFLEGDDAPHDPAWFDLWVPLPSTGLPDGVLTALGWLADALPGQVRTRLRVTLPAGTGKAQARQVRCVLPAPQRILPSTPPDVAGGEPAGEVEGIVRWRPDEHFGVPAPPEAPVEEPGVGHRGGEPADVPVDSRPADAGSGGADLPQGGPGEPRAASTLLAVTAQGRLRLVGARPSGP